MSLPTRHHPISSCSAHQSTATVKTTSDDDSMMEEEDTSSVSDHRGGTGPPAWEQQQQQQQQERYNSNVPSGLFVKTSRPLPLSVSRTVPWPRLWGRGRKNNIMAMEGTDFVTRLDNIDPNIPGCGVALYFRNSGDLAMNDNGSASRRTSVVPTSSHIGVASRRCSTG